MSRAIRTLTTTVFNTPPLQKRPVSEAPSRSPPFVKHASARSSQRCRRTSMPSAKVIPFTPRAQDRHKPSYKWLNAEWGDKQLPWIRLAVVVLGKDDTEIEAAIK